MDSRQFTVNGVTFETHAPTVRDRLRQKRLNTMFYTNRKIELQRNDEDGSVGNTELWTEVNTFTEFATTTVAHGKEQPPYLVSMSADWHEVDKAFNAFMEAPEAVYETWYTANFALTVPSGTPELSPLTDPNASPPPTKNGG